MIVFGAPLWLLLLGLLPWLRWLHRFQRQGRLQPTAELFLWRRIQTEGIAGDTPASPDPRWRLRALIALLMILALANPYRESPSGSLLVVWLDDSLSQFTREGTYTRLQTGIERLMVRVNEINPSRLLIHSLGNPVSTMSLIPGRDKDWAGQLKRWTTNPRGEPRPPAPAVMSRHAQHILVTDGADERLNQWLRKVPGTEVIQTGTSRNNLALTRLAVRSPLEASQKTAGLVELHNFGEKEIIARLILIQRGREIHSQVVALTAGEHSLQHFSLALKRNTDLTARLLATEDPLILDDELRLPLASRMQPIPVATTGECNPHLQAFLIAHPALEQSAQKPEITIVCGNSQEATSTPLLRLHPVNGNRTTHTPGHWHVNDSLQSLTLAKGLRFEPPSNDAGKQGVTLLSAGNISLITETRTSAHIIDVLFDLHRPDLTVSPEYPLLLSALIERLVQRSLSDSTLLVTREIEASRIAPLLRSTENPETTKEESSRQRPLSNLFIILAFSLLLFEVLLEFSSRRGRGT